MWWMLMIAISVSAAIVAFYHFTIAGMIVFEIEYGVLLTRVIVGLAYAAVTVVALLTFWMRGRRTKGLNVEGFFADEAAFPSGVVQIVTLVEAVMLGYQMVRKSARTL